MSNRKINLMNELPQSFKNKMNKGLVAYENPHGIEVNYNKISLVSFNDQNQPAVILKAYTAYSEVYIDDLWVDESYKKYGFCS